MSDENKEDTENNEVPENAEGLVEVLIPKYNLLKNKAGARVNMRDDGYIETGKIEKAQSLIDQLCEGCEDKLKEQTAVLTNVWEEIQQMPDEAERKLKTKDIFTIAHEIRDIASLCGYDLIAHFAESLRDYISETTMNLKNQRIIIQAHVDALKTVLKTGISDHEDPIAEELKEKVKIAIEKYK